LRRDHVSNLTMANVAISAKGLEKRFRVAEQPEGFWSGVKSLVTRPTKEVIAAAGIDLEIAEGDAIGFLGPNGAGKTTTLKMLSGLLVPTSGTASVLGFMPWQRQSAYLQQISLVMGQKQQLIWDLPPRETFLLCKAIYGLTDASYKKSLDELVDRLQIGAVMQRQTRQLSLGERMKCELACALLHRPRILFLDEPTIGLDVAMQDAIRSFLRDYLRESGATMMLTSHYMDDVSALCRSVVVIDAGRVQFRGSIDELVHQTSLEKHIKLRLLEAATAVQKSAFAKACPGLAWEEAGLELSLAVGDQDTATVLTAALSAFRVQDVSVADPPLETALKQFFASSKAKSESSSNA
jgi:ABC-2 type transport system ATP-binding protein